MCWRTSTPRWRRRATSASPWWRSTPSAIGSPARCGSRPSRARSTSRLVGRHGQCDLFLDGDAALSLRHLVVIVEPATDWGGPGGADVRYRLVDLRTGTGFIDEAGRMLEAATALGPAFVMVGRYLLLCFPTGGDEWPRELESALALLPERIYVDERDAEPDRWQRQRRGFAEGTNVEDTSVKPAPVGASVITAVRGPARARIAAATAASADRPVRAVVAAGSRRDRRRRRGAASRAAARALQPVRHRRRALAGARADLAGPRAGDRDRRPACG
jgi:hypothetical protein